MLKLDRGWVPSHQDSSLYIRPFMFATEAHVGVRPSNIFAFVFHVSRWAYYTRPVRVKLELEYTRAAGGTGAAKAAGNYAGSLATELAKSQGYDQILWTDAATHTAVEECGTMNVAFVIRPACRAPNKRHSSLWCDP